MRFSSVIALVTVLLLTGTAHAAGSQVPEPGSLALLTTGAVGVIGYAWWTRRRK